MTILDNTPVRWSGMARNFLKMSRRANRETQPKPGHFQQLRSVVQKRKPFLPSALLRVVFVQAVFRLDETRGRSRCQRHTSSRRSQLQCIFEAGEIREKGMS